MVGPMSQPVLPLIDAAAFNSKTNNIAHLIIEEQKKMVDVYFKNISDGLKSKTGMAVRNGKEIQTENFEKNRVKTGVAIKSENFPIVIFNEGSINLFDLASVKNNMGNTFKDNEKNKNRIVQFVKEANLNNVMVSYHRLAITGVGMFGISGYIRFETYIFIFGENGELLLDGYAWSRPRSIHGDELKEYKFELESNLDLIERLTSELAARLRQKRM
jgi:hypothetical protein